MAEDGNNPAVPEHQYGPTTDAADECPYGHKGWIFLRYGKERVCARCGVRLVNMPGRQLGG